jgi:hypothetical protein
MTRRLLLCCYSGPFIFFALVGLEVGILDPFKVFAENSRSTTNLIGSELPIDATVNPPYHYQMGSRRDPFVPLHPFSGDDGLEVFGDSNSEKPDDLLTLLGVISGKRGYQALVKLPNGERVVVKPGSYLENIHTMIKRITRDAVVIARPLDGEGDSHQVEISLLLSP